MNTDWIDGIIKICIINVFIYSIFFRVNAEQKCKRKIIEGSIISSVIYIIFKLYLKENIFLLVIISYFIQIPIQKMLIEDKRKSIIVSSLIANAVVYATFCISLLFEVFFKFALKIELQTIDLIFTLGIQLALLVMLFSNKRVKNGIEFLKDPIGNEFLYSIIEYKCSSYICLLYIWKL